MKKVLFAVALFAFLFAGCGGDDDELPEVNGVKVRGGEVQEVIQTSAYTYAKIEEKGAGEVWIAAQKMDLKEGEKIYFTQAMEMTNFEGKEAGKTFDKILFVQDATKDKSAFTQKGTTPAELPDDFKHPEQETAQKEEVKVDKAEGGVTIAEIFAKKNELKDKTVKIRGKVTKVNASIMNTNWVHIQDGTGSGNQFDLVFTSEALPKVGEVVLVEGKLSVDKDFGAGYKYDVIVENAKVLETK
ncbi:MAG: OB-fold nucleic acid binding domain-containing protein [Ignavibacteriales bacterium]|nr:MAG: DNA-binding protein [Ignavibacteriaceae bacterium]MBW7871987.1 OB-fold nucleic acid binding domain-containing protein [Ignavibacteria bacterium]MCZ2144082.1 OB-fold nucleic acid binding domain-containing protein [Ignavibacteriales bacterium]MBV6446117.1 hypothetical protein [Ignavibacteriaceae bacterium]MBZ0197399.1 OB-fold nucleic acid binding domain-containing protein [Ignavibacteriaceae bacterium]